MHYKKQIARFVLMIFIGSTYVFQVHAFLAQESKQTLSSVNDIKSPRREIIVLVHGLLRTSLSMWPLKIYLQKQGYHVYSYSYPSPKYSIHEHSIYLNKYIKNLLAENPDVTINFITHSLGGIITREALSTLSKKHLKNIGCLIMLAPPNQGSQLAKLSTKIFPLFTSPIKPLAELSSEQTSYVHRVPIPNIKMGIIAGKYDAKVPPDFARLQGQNEIKVVSSNHTFIMNNAQARQLIMNFLTEGTFAKR